MSSCSEPVSCSLPAPCARCSAVASPATQLVVLARGRAGRELCSALRRAGATVSLIETDLSSLDSVRAAVEALCARLDADELPSLEALVLNAGAQFTNNLTQTPEGFEGTFAINALANHVLIGGLQDRLQTPARIVVTSVIRTSGTCATISAWFQGRSGTPPRP